jgi:hypothetical protein
MHARVNTIFGQPHKVAAGVARVEGTDRAAVEASRGNRGLTTLMDSAGGVIVAVSYWDDLIHSSAPSLTEVRERVAAAAGGDLVAESYTIAWQEPGRTPARTRSSRSCVTPRPRPASPSGGPRPSCWCAAASRSERQPAGTASERSMTRGF